MEYIDLYLLHWPVPADFANTVAAYQAGEKLLADGKIRAIGVSNFSPVDLKNLMDRVKITPAVNQVELHPFFIQREVRAADDRLGIITESWAPIGGSLNRKASATGNARQGSTNQSELRSPLEHPVILKLAAKYGKTPAQVVLRWHIEHGLCAIPKSVHAERIAENIDIFDFALANDEIAAIDALDTGARAGADPEIVGAKTFPIKIED